MNESLVSQIVILLDERVSLNLEEVAKAIGRSQTHTANVLWRLRGDKVFHWPSVGPGRWCLKKHFPAVKAAHEELLRQRARERYQRSAVAKKARQEAELQAWCNRERVVVKIDAAVAPKIRLLGPSSIWDAARMAA